MTQDRKPAKTGAKQKDEDTARARRIAQERGANDPDYRPTERDAQIDASGARFRSDG